MKGIVEDILVLVSLILGTGYGAEKLYIEAKMAALEKIHQGLPPLSGFTSQLTCSKISMKGDLVPLGCKSKNLR